MITLQQIQLLDEKIESCLAKIDKLSAENDALCRKCAELTNALSAKSESLSAFQQDQSKIEEGILKALERLNAVENSILTVTGAVPSSPKTVPPVSNQSSPVQVSRPVQSQSQQPTVQGSVQQNVTQPDVVQQSVPQQIVRPQQPVQQTPVFNKSQSDDIFASESTLKENLPEEISITVPQDEMNKKSGGYANTDFFDGNLFGSEDTSANSDSSELAIF